MLSLGPIAFAAPWLLLALPALPILWWLLRVTPPAPRRIAFPALRLLRDLPVTQETPARTPWWLLLLRIAAAALLVLGLARPVLGPGGATGGEGTLLLVVDDGWAAAADWPSRMAAASAALERAGREGRRAALLATAPAETGDAPRVLGPMPAEAVVLARTADGRALAQATIPIPANAGQAEGVLDLPLELRNQVVRLELEGETGAGGVALLDERFRRRPVGLLPPQEESADAPLIGDLFYLDRALGPYAELRRGPLDRLLARPIAVLALADRPVPEGAEREALTRWVERGGTLVRFAGPRLAERPDPLLPVPLRAERQLGGALSWEQPQRLAPFPEGSPFLGLPVPEEVTVERQVLAEPSPRLSERTWARLGDGTPLVTAEARGAGRVILFHVTANAEWSNLPLSGLFVQMLRRIVALAAGIQGAESDAPLAPLETLDGFGRLGPAPPAAAALPASAIDAATPSPRNPPGWYGTPGQDAANAAYRRALNLGGALPPPR
ncbi:BatA domain-containing protein, partial [Paracraurococcus ruber]|uniref:BatA domain-containing protein n=1 Tax=Paracraurococcus ruber TaxID=77675 RepID=UPI001F5BCF9D